MSLGSDFKYAEILKVRDGDNDGFIYDGTPRQRPAPRKPTGRHLTKLNGPVRSGDTYRGFTFDDETARIFNKALLGMRDRNRPLFQAFGNINWSTFFKAGRDKKVYLNHLGPHEKMLVMGALMDLNPPVKEKRAPYRGPRPKDGDGLYKDPGKNPKYKYVSDADILRAVKKAGLVARTRAEDPKNDDPPPRRDPVGEKAVRRAMRQRRDIGKAEVEKGKTTAAINQARLRVMNAMRKWQENMHPRGPGGRFRDKPGGGTSFTAGSRRTGRAKTPMTADKVLLGAAKLINAAHSQHTGKTPGKKAATKPPTGPKKKAAGKIDQAALGRAKNKIAADKELSARVHDARQKGAVLALSDNEQKRYKQAREGGLEHREAMKFARAKGQGRPRTAPSAKTPATKDPIKRVAERKPATKAPKAVREKLKPPKVAPAPNRDDTAQKKKLAENRASSARNKALDAHFDKGGSMADAPHGMFEYAQAHPERFEVTRDLQGVSGAKIIRDKETGELRFFKKTAYGHPVGNKAMDDPKAETFKFDLLNEVVMSSVMQELGIDVPTIRGDGDMNSRDKASVSAEHADDFGRRTGLAVNLDDFPPRDAEIDMQSFWNLYMFDYLSSQVDRHSGNIGWGQDEKGVWHVIPVDNGGVYDALRSRDYTDYDQMGLAEYADQDVAEWLATGHASTYHNTMVSVLGGSGRGQKARAVQRMQESTEFIDQFIQRFKKVDLGAIADKVIEDNNLEGEAADHVYDLMRIMLVREEIFSEAPDEAVTALLKGH